MGLLKLVSAVLVTALTFSQPAAGAEKPLKIALSEDYAPWSHGHSLNAQGLAIELTQGTLQKMGYKVEYRGLPWVRAQRDAFRGKFDALCAVLTPQRMKYLKPSKRPLLSINVKVYIQNNEEALGKFKNVKDLRTLNQVPGIFNVYIGAGWSPQNLDKKKIEYSSSIENTIRKLAGGHGDAVVENSLVVGSFIKKLGLEKSLRELPVVIDSMDFYLLVRRDLTFDFDKFDELFKEFAKTKEYKDILKKYAGSYSSNLQLKPMSSF